jgi:tRNA A58 N-methylase Trm61
VVPPGLTRFTFKGFWDIPAKQQQDMLEKTISDIRDHIKGFILSILPDKILQAIKKVHYARALSAVSEGDEVDFKIIKQLVNPGDYVADIGANYGVYTKYLSELVGRDGCVYSIEPIPLTFEILYSNVKKLGLNQQTGGGSTK